MNFLFYFPNSFEYCIFFFFQISPKSDVWSLGCILYLLLYKKTPFAHIKNIYAKMQAIIDPNKKIDYPDLPNYYPSMLLEVSYSI